MNRIKDVTTIMKRELAGYFASPIAYIVITIFLIFTGFFFFKDFFYLNQADMRNFFQMLPLVFTFVIPAVTMRLFSEERQSGSLEILLTLPVSTRAVVTGKLLAASVFVGVMLLPTIVYLTSIIAVGSPDPGPIIGGYIGALLLGASYASIGILASSLTRNQIIAFIGSLSVTLFLWLIDKIVAFLPSALGFFDYLGSDFHFQNIARGVIDTRDLVYFLSVIVICTVLTEKVLEERR